MQSKKKSDAAVAAEIEVKKTARKAGRKVKETIEDAAAQAATSDAAVAAEIEVKKTARKAGRKAKEVVETVAAETKKAVRRASLEIIIQSPMGGAISTDEIASNIGTWSNFSITTDNGRRNDCHCFSDFHIFTHEDTFLK